VHHPPLSPVAGFTEAKKEIEAMRLMSMARTVSILTTYVTMKFLGQLTGTRRLDTQQMAMPSTPPMHTLQRLFSVKRKLRIRKGLGALAGAQTMIKLTSMEHTAQIERLKVLSSQRPRESVYLAIALRLDA
jgi:hypothetical protein